MGVTRIECIQVHNVKYAVRGLAVANAVACFITQGPGVKVEAFSFKWFHFLQINLLSVCPS